MSRVNDSDTCIYDQYWEKDFVPPYLDSLFPAFEQLGILREAKVLDIGCGNGALGDFLIRKYGCRMYGIDISAAALKAAAARGYAVELVDPDSGASFHRPFPEVQFDVVVLSAVLEHVPKPTFRRQEIFEYLMYQAPYGGRTVVEQVSVLDSAPVHVLRQEGPPTTRPRPARCRHRARAA